jgi:hypothetical protein
LKRLEPVALHGYGVRLEPLRPIQKDGTIRDTVMYSIVDAEWPDVERALRARLATALR